MRDDFNFFPRTTDTKPEMVRNLLLIDDDKELVEALSEYLPKFNFKVHAAHAPSDGMKLLESRTFDAVVLDVMLPEKSGIQVCKELREKTELPIMMLTARGDLTDRIVGLEVGADDYLPKPFEPRELVARLEAILRRSKSIAKKKNILFRDLSINLQDHTVNVRGSRVELTSMEFEILVLLASHPGQVFTRDHIMDHLRGEEYDCFSRTIDVMLSKLRSKLKDDPKRPTFIKTVWGSGYIFLGVEDEAA